MFDAPAGASLQMEISIRNLHVKVAQILIHARDEYKTIAQEQVNEKADVVVICLDAAGPLSRSVRGSSKVEPNLGTESTH